MQNEKKFLLTVFTLIFCLSISLIYLMLSKDIKMQLDSMKRMSDSTQFEDSENNWPKVEIKTRK